MLQLNNHINKLSSNRIVINGLDYKYNTTIGRYHCKFQSGNGHDNLEYVWYTECGLQHEW